MGLPIETTLYQRRIERIRAWQLTTDAALKILRGEIVLPKAIGLTHSDWHPENGTVSRMRLQARDGRHVTHAEIGDWLITENGEGWWTMDDIELEQDYEPSVESSITPAALTRAGERGENESDSESLSEENEHLTASLERADRQIEMLRADFDRFHALRESYVAASFDDEQAPGMVVLKFAFPAGLKVSASVEETLDRAIAMRVPLEEHTNA